MIKGLAVFLLFETILLFSSGDRGSLIIAPLLNLSRTRFPISTKAPIDAALDLGNLDAMFAAHIVSQPKASNEYRVFIFGDSAVWGIGLTPGQTLPGQMEGLGLKCGSKNLRFYNLSFPQSSASKDLMILDKAMQYQPDMIIWMVTWYTLSPKARVDNWLVSQNPRDFYGLASRFRFLPRDYPAPTLVDQFYDQNRTLFHILRFDLFSLINMSTGMDQIPGPPDVLPSELGKDPIFEGMKPPTLNVSQVSLGQVVDFYLLAKETPVLLVNQPMLVLRGVPNSDVRYNDYYPRWVYDQYRQYLGQAASQHGWNYLDFWNIFSPAFFTDTPLHLTPQGEEQLALRLGPSVQKGCP